MSENNVIYRAHTRTVYPTRTTAIYRARSLRRHRMFDYNAR